MLIHQHHVCPHAIQVCGVCGQPWIDQRSQCRELIRRGSTALVLAFNRGISGVGSNPIFPIRTAIPADRWDRVAELLGDILERGVKAGVLQMRIRVDAVPLLCELRLPGEKIGVLHLRAKDDRGISAIGGLLVLLQK